MDVGGATAVNDEGNDDGEDDEAKGEKERERGTRAIKLHARSESRTGGVQIDCCTVRNTCNIYTSRRSDASGTGS